MAALPKDALPTDPVHDLFLRYRGVVYRAAYGITGSHADAEEVLQDVFLGLPQALRSFEGRGSMEGWIRRISVRTALSRVRKRRRRSEVSFQDAPATGSEGSDTAPVDRISLETAIARLPQSLRSVFVLKDVEGYSHAEIGELLGIRAATSEVRLHRARRALRMHLREES